MKSFTDNFSAQSAVYAENRPTYPTALFEFLHSLTPEHSVAWDCGTGNGQAAFDLVNYFDNVIATDPSETQIKNAAPHPKIIYKVEKAEASSVQNNSVDLITVAQAIHWFDFEPFYKEVYRVLKPNGVFAAWTYVLPEINAAVDDVIKYFYDGIVGPYWPKERKMVEEEYATIPFPFEIIPAPDFFTEKNISLDGLYGLLRSWSATQKYIDKNGTDPVEKITQQLSAAWGDARSTKRITWRIILKAGRPSL